MQPITDARATTDYMGARRRIDIELFLQWAMRNQSGAGESGQLGSRLGYPGASALVRIGAFVDRALEAPSSSLGHPDADVAITAVKSLRHKAARVLLRHAAEATRPAVLSQLPAQQWRPEMEWHKGAWRPRVIWNSGRNYQRLCPVQYVDNRGLIEAARAEYLLWHTALGAVARGLTAPPTRLVQWWPEAPAASAAPWLFAEGLTKTIGP